MQHVEFFDKSHFERFYQRYYPGADLTRFIDYIWETDFENLLEQNPKGFSDVLFPNIGYTYLINLGTPFVMQVDEEKFNMRGDGFLPRHKALECYHQSGNHLFGIKFKVSPVLFQKRINFSEYRSAIFPLSYLIDPQVAGRVKAAARFEDRVNILCQYFQSIIRQYEGALQTVDIVTKIIEQCQLTRAYHRPMEDWAGSAGISTRTLQRYFLTSCSLSGKQALQIMRIRAAAAHLASDPVNFHFSYYSYYDYSHFCKHLRSFMRKQTLERLQPHLRLLESLHH